MPQLNVGTTITPQHATALATLAARGHVQLPDISAVLGAGMPGAGRAELLQILQTLIPRAQADVATAAQELMHLVTAGPVAGTPWSQALPPGKTQAHVTLYGKRTDQDDGCHVPSRSGDALLTLTLHEGFVEYANVRAPIGSDGCFSGRFNDNSGGFSGRVRGSVVEFQSVSRFQVSQGNRTFMSETRYDARGMAGGPGFTAAADEVRPIRARTGSQRAPYGLAFGLPADVGDGRGDDVQRRGNGQLQGFAMGGKRTIVALLDGRKEAAVVSGSALATWQAQWTANDCGPLGYPVGDAHSFQHRGQPITVQVFEGGYVFGDGTVEARSDAEAAFRTRFPEYKTPEELEAARQAAFQREHRDRQTRQILSPVFDLLRKRQAERKQGYTHREPNDFVAAESFIRKQLYWHDVNALMGYLRQNWRP